MSDERDLERIVQSWLHEGREEADRVLDSALDEIEATPQRRVGWMARTGTTVRIGLMAAAVVLVAFIGIQALGGPRVGGPTPPGPSQLAPSPSTLPALDLPGARGGGPGEYGWTGELGSITAMHSVVPTDSNGAFRETQLFFAVRDDCFVNGEGQTPVPVTVAGFDGLYVEPFHDPAVLFYARGGERTGAYALAIEGRTLCVYFSWDPTTTQAELDAGHAVIESLRAEPIGSDGIRIVFTLTGGWDTG